MDDDLRDLLTAWRGGTIDPARATALLDKVRADEAFRRAFVGEIRLLGMLKAVQATDPRWLLLEDELGWTADERDAGDRLEDRVASRIAEQPRPRSLNGLAWAALAAAVLVGASTVVWSRRDRGVPPAVAVEAKDAPPFVAVVVELDGAKWEPAGGPVAAVGRPLPEGKLRLREGRVTLALFNGVVLSVEGPAHLDLESVGRVYCRQGKLRARVPPGAEGFTILSPGSAVVDLGTEFGMNVAADGTSDLMVFEGKAEVSVLNKAGHTLQSELLEGRKAVSVDPAAGRIRDVAAVPGAFVAAPVLISPPLPLDPSYADAVRASRPWGYWRFESLTDGAVPNEFPDRPPLRATGPVNLSDPPGGNRVVLFGRTPAEQHLIMDGAWVLPRQTGYAVELWALAEEVNVGALVNLISRPDELIAQKHLFILELAGQGHHLVHDPCVVRYLDRWPPAHSGGVNVFSRNMYVPYRWHHLVARRVPGQLELYMDGELAGSSPVDQDDGTPPTRLMVGRLKHGKQPNINQERPFIGRLDELAVYDHPLAPEDIRRHYELGAGR